MTRKLYQIAKDIRADWTKRHSSPAYPYLCAMAELDSLSDMYGADSAKSVVLYFLANASTWRGETARRIKAELNAMLAEFG